MILQEWGEIRQLYKDCRPRLATWPWYLWVSSSLFLLFVALVPVVALTTNKPWIHALNIFLVVSVRWLVWFTSEKALANDFKGLYTIHGLRQYPRWRRQFYLHYARFLCGLTDRPFPVSRKTITQLREFADIAWRPPRPESQRLQPHYIVPYIVLLNLFFLEVLKKADLLEGEKGIYILKLSAYALGLGWLLLSAVHVWWHEVTNWGQTDNRIIQRFLQWAERDIEEAQLLRTQRLRAEAPGPHGPSR